MQKNNELSKPFKLSETSLAYLKWRICEMESKEAWKKEKCKILWEKYRQSCLKK